MPERKRFNEEVKERLDTFGKQLLEDIPELEGVGVALTYAPDLGDPEPQCYAYARDGDPRRGCRMAIQTSKLLGLHVNNIAAAVQQILASMPTEEIDGKEANTRTDGSEETEAGTGESTPANGSADPS